MRRSVPSCTSAPGRPASTSPTSCVSSAYQTGCRPPPSPNTPACATPGRAKHCEPQNKDPPATQRHDRRIRSPPLTHILGTQAPTRHRGGHDAPDHRTRHGAGPGRRPGPPGRARADGPRRRPDSAHPAGKAQARPCAHSDNRCRAPRAHQSQCAYPIVDDARRWLHPVVGPRGEVVMRRLGMRARWGIAVAAALMVIAIPLALAQGAGAAPVPPGDFTCGVTVFTACNQTANFDTPSGTSVPVVGEPNPQAIRCPAFVAVDAPVIQGTGNGIEHAIINNNGDGWFTSTFAGTVTVVSWTVDSAGNLVAPDPSVPVFTGHLQFWFGGSFNNKNFVNHDTINFTGTAADGSTFGIHEVDHLSTSAVVTAAPSGFSITHC